MLIWDIAPYKTPTWSTSIIAWGTPLKDDPAHQDVMFEESPRSWRSVFKATKIPRTWILSRYYALYGEYRVPDRWVFNDFGAMAIRYFDDKNHNGRRDTNKHDRKKDEPISGEMFHTTDLNEAETARHLGLHMDESHGCIHLRPPQRAELISMGAFERYTPLTVHKYDEAIPKKWAMP